MKTTTAYGASALATQAVGFAMVIACMQGCAALAGTEPQRWRVVDPMSNPQQPIAGATVLIASHGGGSAIGHSTSSCSELKVLKSDQDGWVSVSVRVDRMTEVAAHKTGHAYPNARYLTDGRKRETYLTPNASEEQRIKQFWSLNGLFGCSVTETSRSALMDLIDAVSKEVAELPPSNDQRKLLDQMKGWHRIYSARPGEQR